MKDRIKNSILEIENPIVDLNSNEDLPFKSDQKWFNILWGFICLALILLAVRVFYLTIIKGNYYSEIAEGNSVYSVPIMAPRGEVLDKNGKVLAKNIPNQSIIINPANLPKVKNDEDQEEVNSVTEERKKIANVLKEKLDLNVENTLLKMELSVKNKEPISLKENVSQEESLIITGLQKELSGIEVDSTALRQYPEGEFFSHILGYEGLIKKEELEQNKEGYLLTDRIGKTGIEFQYEKYLRGVHGATQSIVDSRGRLIRDLKDEPAKKGSNVYLNIDAELQAYSTKTLKKHLDSLDVEEKGTIIAINPKNGAVLTMVSLPSYDNNLFAKGISSEDYNSLILDKKKPLFNRAISGAYAPGSTIKPVMALAVLKEKIVTPNLKIESKGGIEVGGSWFGDWKAHGFTDMRRAIAVSSDVYFYTVCGGYGEVKGLGIEKMKEYAEKFGYGQKSGIDLPSEVSGFYPTPEWKLERKGERWYLGDTYHASIGQGDVLATPLQILDAISVIANGGTLYKPKIVSHVIDVNGNKMEVEPEIIRDNIATSSEIKVVQEGMRETVLDGTATKFQDLPVAVAGKTGTAEVGMTKGKVHSWFVSYAPYEDPDFALIVMMEDLPDTVSSPSQAVAYDIYKWYYGGRKEDEEEKSK